MHRVVDRYSDAPTQGGAARGAADSAPVALPGQQGGAVSNFRKGSGSARGTVVHNSLDGISPSPAQVDYYPMLLKVAICLPRHEHHCF